MKIRILLPQFYDYLFLFKRYLWKNSNKIEAQFSCKHILCFIKGEKRETWSESDTGLIVSKWCVCVCVGRFVSRCPRAESDTSFGERRLCKTLVTVVTVYAA